MLSYKQNTSYRASSTVLLSLNENWLLQRRYSWQDNTWLRLRTQQSRSQTNSNEEICHLIAYENQASSSLYSRRILAASLQIRFRYPVYLPKLFSRPFLLSILSPYLLPNSLKGIMLPQQGIRNRTFRKPSNETCWHFYETLKRKEGK